MVDGLHIHIQNRMMKPLATAVKWGGKGGYNLTNVQYKAHWNCHIGIVTVYSHTVNIF
jgi:hypothetical protein